MSEERLTNIEHSMKGIRSELTGVNTRLDGMDRRFDNLEGKVDSLGGRVDSLEAKVDSLDAKVDSLDAKVDRTLVQFESLQDGFRIFGEAQVSLEERVTRGFADIPRQIAEALRTLDLTVRSHTTELADHDGRIERLETR